MADNIKFKKVAIIGVGLIGGSIAMVLRQKGMAASIVGVGRGEANLKAAVRLGVIDSYSHDISVGAAGADLVIVAVPVLRIAEAVKAAALVAAPGAVITDAGSVKGAVIEGVGGLLPSNVAFVPGHPIAGTEHSGVEAAFATLYEKRLCILTPTASTDKGAVAKVRAVWEAAGSNVIEMDAARHDRILAAVSHLPHVIAYTLVNAVAENSGLGSGVLNYSAGGFKDFTRIASSSPEMWTEILAMNRAMILEMIDAFRQRLDGLRDSIERGELDRVRADFENAKGLRDAMIAGGAAAGARGGN